MEVVAYNDRRQVETKQFCRIEEEKAVGSLHGNGKGRFPSDVKTAGIELRNRGETRVSRFPLLLSRETLENQKFSRLSIIPSGK